MRARRCFNSTGGALCSRGEGAQVKMALAFASSTLLKRASSGGACSARTCPTRARAGGEVMKDNREAIKVTVPSPPGSKASAAFPLNESGGGVVEYPDTITTPLPGQSMDVELFYEKAKATERGGDIATALRMYTHVLQADPTYGKAYIRKSMIYQRQKRFESARSVLRRGLKRIPTNAILWQNWADLENQQGHHETARRLYDKALEANQWLHSIYNSWGNMEYNVGNVCRARALFTRGLKFQPGNARLLHSLALLEDKRHNHEEAENLLTSALKSEPHNAYLHQALSLVHFKQGRTSSARECLRRALKVDPKHALSYLTWARIEELQRNFDLARKLYSQGTELALGSCAPLWQAWARMEENLGNDENALALYKSAISKLPGDARLYCECGKMYRKLGDSKLAMKLFRKSGSVDPSDPMLYKTLASLVLEEESSDAARRVFRQGLAHGTGIDVAPMLHAWAVLEWNDGNNNEARKLFEMATQVNPNCAWLWMWYGMLEKDCANVDLARHYFLRSINTDSKDGSAWRAWAELERAQGNEDRARFCFRRARDLDNRKELCVLDSERPLARTWQQH